MIKQKTLALINEYENKLKSFKPSEKISKLINEIKPIRVFTISYYKYLNSLKNYDSKFQERYDRFSNNLRYFADATYNKKKFGECVILLKSILKELKILKEKNKTVISKAMKWILYEDIAIINKNLHRFNLFIKSGFWSGKLTSGQAGGTDFKLITLEQINNLFKSHNAHKNGFVNTFYY